MHLYKRDCLLGETSAVRPRTTAIELPLTPCTAWTLAYSGAVRRRPPQPLGPDVRPRPRVGLLVNRRPPSCPVVDLTHPSFVDELSRRSTNTLANSIRSLSAVDDRLPTVRQPSMAPGRQSASSAVAPRRLIGRANWSRNDTAWGEWHCLPHPWRRVLHLISLTPLSIPCNHLVLGDSSPFVPSTHQTYSLSRRSFGGRSWVGSFLGARRSTDPMWCLLNSYESNSVNLVTSTVARWTTPCVRPSRREATNTDKQSFVSKANEQDCVDATWYTVRGSVVITT